MVIGAADRKGGGKIGEVYLAEAVAIGRSALSRRSPQNVPSATVAGRVCKEPFSNFGLHHTAITLPVCHKFSSDIEDLPLRVQALRRFRSKITVIIAIIAAFRGQLR